MKVFEVAEDGSLTSLRSMEDGEAKLHETLSMSRLVAAHDAAPRGLAFLGNGRLLSAAGHGSRWREMETFGDVRLWDLESGRLLQTYMREGERNLVSLAVSPNQKFVAACTWDGVVYFHELPLE